MIFKANTIKRTVKEMKLKDTITKIKYDISVTVKACRLVEKFTPHFILHSFLFSFFEVTSNFYGIFFSGEMLNEIVGNRDIKKLIFLAAITVGGQSLLVLLSKISWRKLRVGLVVCEQWEEMYLNDRSFSMDYKNTEDPSVRSHRQSIVDNRDVGGISYLGRLTSIFRSSLNIVFSVLILLTMVFHSSKMTLSPFLSFVDSGWMIAVLLVVSSVCSVLIGKVSKKFNDNMFFYNQKLPVINRLMKFYLSDYLDDSKAHKDVHIFSQSSLIINSITEMVKKWTKENDNRLDSQWNFELKVEIVNYIIKALVYAFVAIKVIIGSMGLGDFLRYSQTISELMTAFAWFGNSATGFHNNVKYIEKFFEYVDIPTEMHYGTIPTEKRSDNIYDIEFHNVSFRYPHSDVYAIKNLSFKFKVGEKVAVVGMNGSGKTTMIKLLCRLYDPTEGYITLNGIDITKYDYEDYLALFSVVFQDFRLFSFSLGENVACTQEYDDDKVLSCLNIAGMKERVSSLPDGLKSVIYKDFDENGIEISGGEAQKIAIARALYKDAPFVILDEPTASLDPIAEYEIYSRFNDMVENKTAVYISHRLSSCRFCDKIAVFHEGEIIQFGSHEDLLKETNGKYCELWTAQAQYYTDKTTA